MDNIKFGLQQNLNFSTYGFGTISLKNPEFNYNGIILTVDGEVGFEDFDKIINQKVFNFDADFTKPLEGGHTLTVNKPVSIQCGLHPSICAEILSPEYNEDILRTIVLDYIRSEEEFLISENWSIFTLSQLKGEKLIGYQTIWNTIDYTAPNIVEDWEAITGKAAMPFLLENEELFNKIKAEQKEATQEDLSFDEFKQFQSFLSDENNPLSEMLSQITDGDENIDLQNVLGEMSNMFSNFGEEETENESLELDVVEAIAEYLSEENVAYSYDEENSEFNVQFIINEKNRTGKIIQHNDYYIVTKIAYSNNLENKTALSLYRFMNVVNSGEFVGKIYLDEANHSIFVQTNLILTFEFDESERVVDIIDANVELCNQVFPILESLTNGSMDIETAIEQYQNNGEDTSDFIEDFDF